MSDMLFSLQISRDLLGLPDLDLNDHLTYYLAPQSFGGTVTWNRNQVQSPFIDGSVTVNRTKQQITENVAIEVLSSGSGYGNLMTALTNVINAFTQDTFDLQLSFGSHVLQYACEAADYAVSYDSSRWIGRQVQVVFSVPRQPDPVSGGF